MRYRAKLTMFVFLIWVIAFSGFTNAQAELGDQKNLTLASRAVADNHELFHLFPAEEEQESGNAVPVLLRMVFEKSEFMGGQYFKLRDYANLDVQDPKLSELQFDSFAKQIIRAGGMSRAEWEYPLRSDNPYTILLPDIQSQRQLVGQGMRAWVKQRLAKGDMDAALTGIKAQLGCARTARRLRSRLATSWAWRSPTWLSIISNLLCRMSRARTCIGRSLHSVPRLWTLVRWSAGSYGLPPPV